MVDGGEWWGIDGGEWWGIILNVVGNRGDVVMNVVISVMNYSTKEMSFSSPLKMSGTSKRTMRLR